jgi:hypothetical protein
MMMKLMMVVMVMLMMIDEDDAQAYKILATAWWIPFREFPLHIPFRSEVSWFSGVFVSLI